MMAPASSAPRPRTLNGCALGHVFVALVCCAGCRSDPPPSADEYAVEERPPTVQEADERLLSEPLPPALATDAAPALSPDTRDRRTRAAPTSPDREYASSEVIRARRYVYRVHMIVPEWLGESDERVAHPAPELFIDVTDDRLRARFAGSGWPVPAGSEVRIRRGRPGAYLFDPTGGRPLAPGELARWFEGGPVTRRGPGLLVVPSRGALRGAPSGNQRGGSAGAGEVDDSGDLFSALLEEWWGERSDEARARCELGAPHVFRVGFWRAEQTAGVPVELPRSALRADEGDPPGYIAMQETRALLEPAALARLASLGPVPPDFEAPFAPSQAGAVAPGSGAISGFAAPTAMPTEGLRVVNESQTRVIVTVQGVPIGWLGSRTSAHFVGLRPGLYLVGAVRPIGAVVQRGREVAVPGVHRICDGHCRPGRRARPTGP
jgi:hypothetical protein